MSHENNDMTFERTFPGGQLRERRIELKLSIESAAAECAIPISMIDALESGGIDRLPTTCYALGFIRSYCRLLQLDSEAFEFALKEARAETASTAVRLRLGQGMLGKALSYLPIPRIHRVPPEVQTWIVIIGVLAGAWVAYSAVVQPGQPIDATEAHAATIDIQLPDNLD